MRKVNNYTHWGQNNANNGSDNDLWPVRHQAIIWINANLLSVEPLETNFSEISITIHQLSFKNMNLKMSSEK